MKIEIFLGTGGVGKTSVAAATALKAALGGGKCLVLTIDPALRLRTALGLNSEGIEQRVSLEGHRTSGELWAGMMDVKATLDRAVRLYAEKEQAEIVLNHPVYQVLIQSLAGMQELLAIERIDQALAAGFENIFIDTAPSRHAFEFLDKPEFFAQLVSFPVVRMVGRTYKLWEKMPFAKLGRKTLELYSKVEDVLGSSLVRQVLDFYSVFRTIAEGYAERATRTCRLLHDPQITAFTIVTSPLKSHRDAEFYISELSMRAFSIQTLVVNRLWPQLREDAQDDSFPPLAQELFAWYRNVSTLHQQVWEQAKTVFSGRIPKLVGLAELPSDVDGLLALHRMASNLGGSSDG